MKLFNLTALLTTAIMGAATAAEPNQTTERGEILRIWPYSPWCNIASNEQLCTCKYAALAQIPHTNDHKSPSTAT